MSHSQISRSQLALKKRNQPTATQIPIIDVDHQNGTKARKSHVNGSSKHSDDNDVIVLDDFETQNVMSQLGAVEEVVTEIVAAPLPPTSVVEDSPSKKRSRPRKSKDSVDSKDSDSKKLAPVEITKTPVLLAAPEPVVVVAAVAEPEVIVAAELPQIEKETKVVRLTTETLSEKKRRSDRLQNASTIVNLSSASEQSTKIMADETIETPTSIPERRVSGRRSTRPIDDIKFTYRTQNDTLNASINATIGSEINDSLMTPVTDRKRRVNDDGSMDNIDSPKRSRLDLTGLFSSFTSPVSMLRNKFRRTNLASTPVVGGGNLAPLDTSVEPLDNSIDEEEESQMKEIDLNEKSDNEKITENVIDGNEILADDDEPKPTAKKSTCAIM
jgi:hypothetical protein